MAGPDPIEEQRRKAIEELLADQQTEELERREYRRKSYDMTNQSSPDDAAEALKLGDKFGLPRQAIELDPEMWKQRDRDAQRRLFEQASPRTMAWLDNSDNHAVARDEVDLWGSIEGYFGELARDPISTGAKTGAAIGRAGTAGWLSFQSTTADADREQLEKASRYYDELDAWKAREAERKAQGKGGFMGRLGRTDVTLPPLYAWGQTEGLRVPLIGDTDPMPQPTARLLDEAIKKDRTWWQTALGIPGSAYRENPEVITAIKPLIQDKMDEAVRVSVAKNKAVDDAMPQTGDFLADSLLGGVRAFTEMTPLIVSAIASRGKSIPTAVMGAQVYYNEYATGRERGLDIEKATERAVLQAGVEAVSERISLGIIDNMLKDNGSLALRFGKGMILEQGQEQIATMGGRLVDWAYLEQGKTVDEFIAETPRYALQTAITTLVASSGMQTTFLAADYATRALLKDTLMMQPSTADEKIDDLLNAVAKSKLRTRAPEKAAELATKLTEGTGAETVVIDLDGLAQSLEAAGLDVMETMTEMGIPAEAINERAIVMGQVEVPTARLMVSNGIQAYRDKVQPHLRLASEDLTPAQKEAIGAEASNQAAKFSEAIREDVARDADFAGQIAEVEEAVTTQLREAGFSGQISVLRANAVLASRMAAYVAKRRGQDVRDVWKEIGPTIVGQFGGVGETAAPDVLRQAKEAGYQGRDRGEAESWVRAVEKGLDMSVEGIKARAREQGFDTERVLYNGRGSDVSAFPDATFLTDDPNGADWYATNRGDAPQIVPVYARIRNPFTLGDAAAAQKLAEIAQSVGVEATFTPDTGRGWSFEARLTEGPNQFTDNPIDLVYDKRVREALKAEGYDAVIDPYDVLENSSIKAIVPLDPANIRSVNAAFDPDNARSADLLAQSIRAAAQMPMAEVDAWVRANVTASESQMGTDTLTVMKFPLTEDPDAPEVMLSIRLKERSNRRDQGRADVNLFLDNQMADALDSVEDPVQRGVMAKTMFAKTVMVMRQYAQEYDLKAFNFTAAESQAEGTKAKSREALYRYMLSSLQMPGYTAYEIESQTSIVNRDEDGAKSANPMLGMAGFVIVKDGVNVEDFARNEILRGSQRGGDVGEVVTVARATPLGRANPGDRGGRGRGGAGAADAGGFAGDELNQLIGPKAKSADKAILNRAKQMAKERVKVGKGLLAKTKPKYTRQQIWDETAKLGQPWYQDKNGDWISEIEDGVIVVRDGKGPLSEVIEFPSIYAEYPQLTKMRADARDKARVKRETGKEEPGGVGGWYQKNPFLFGVHVRIISRGNSREYTATHEIQHAVDDIEGREMGRKKPYYSMDTERRAFNTMYRRLMTMEERIARPPWETEAEAVNWWSGLRDTGAEPARFTPKGTPDPGPTIEPPEQTMPKSRADENVTGSQETRDLAMPGEQVARGGEARVYNGDDQYSKAQVIREASINPLAMLGRTFLTMRELLRSAAKNERIAQVINTKTATDVLTKVEDDVAGVFAEYAKIKADPRYADTEYSELDLWTIAAENYPTDVLLEGTSNRGIAEEIYDRLEAGKSQADIVNDLRGRIERSPSWMNYAVQGLTRRSKINVSPRTKTEENAEVKRVEAALANKLLDMDKTLDQQPDNVRAVFEKIIAAEQARPDLLRAEYEQTMPGYFDGMTLNRLLRELAESSLYEDGSSYWPGDDPYQNGMVGLIRQLRAAGIVGARYVPGGVKEDGAPPSQSIVIFDERAPVLLTDQSGNLMQERRGGFSPSTGRITFTEARDLSTFMHETAHWFLDTLEKLAPTEAWAAADLAEIDAWYQSVRDTPKMAAIRARYAVTPTAGGFQVMYQGQPMERPFATEAEAIARIEWRERQEAFAETFEQYLQTGKAPTPKLIQVFRAFRDWLVNLYRGMMPGERAALNPAIREVFDRVLAVDTEVDAASAEAFRDADTMAKDMLAKGVITERQYRMVGERLNKAREEVKEEMIARAMQEEMRQREDWWAKEKARIKGDLARTFDKSEVGRAFNWLAYGEWKGDTEVQAEEAVAEEEYGALFQSAVPTPEEIVPSPRKRSAFYSALLRVVRDSKTKMATADQWLATIQNAPGIKAEEVEWTGVMEWLDLQEGSVTREALAQFVEANGVRVEEVTKGGGSSVSADAQRQMLPLIEERDRVLQSQIREFTAVSLGEANLEDLSSEDQARYLALGEQVNALNEQITNLQRTIDLGLDDAMSGTKWSSYTLPGGENYREMLLTLPMSEPPLDTTGWSAKYAGGGMWDIVDAAGVVRSRDIRAGIETADPSADQQRAMAAWMQSPSYSAANNVALASKKDVFRSSHWSEPNVLAHVRFKERTGPNGERVLALEEIQSDWHQAGREGGYQGVDGPTEEQRRRFEDMRRRFAQGGLDPEQGGITREEYAEYLSAPFAQVDKKVPNAPFKNNAWTELVLKRMIRFAAENGFDAVAWIPGNIQNGRVVETDDNRGDFYDKIVPNAANKLGKKYGARVTQAPIDMPAQAKGTGWEDTGAPRQARDAGALQWWTLPITPELRDAAINEGFPLFQPRTFNPPGHGPVTPPPNVPPVRLDLKIVKDLYGEEAVRKLPAAVRRRSSTSSNVTDMLAMIDTLRKTLAKRRKGPQTLTQFIMRRKATMADGTKEDRAWGIKGAAAELKAMGLEKLINEKSGRTLDYVREAAEEAGFIRPRAVDADINTQPGDLDTTENDLLAALAREARGEAVVRFEDEGANKELTDARTWADWLSQNGVDIYETDKKKLRASVEAMLRNTDESLISPDQAAQLFGFKNGEELLAALAQVGNRDKFLDEQAERALANEFGDMMKDGTLIEEAREAARLSILGRQSEIELEALSRAVGQQASTNYARQMARDIIAMRTVKEIAAYERDFDNERRFSKQALTAVSKGDYATALKAKQRQIIAAQMYREGKKAHERIEKQRKDLLKYLTSESRRDKIANDYLERIDAVLDDYELRVSKQGPGVQKARQSAAAYVAWMTDQGREAEIAPEAMLLATQASLKTWRNLTAEEVEYLVGTIENLAHLGKTKQRLLNDKERREFRAVVAEIIGVLEAAPSARKRGKSFSPGMVEGATVELSKYDAKLTKIPDEFEWLDGKQAGPLATSILLPIEQADVRKMTMIRAATKEVRRLWKAMPANMRKALVNKRVATPELPLPRGDTMTMMDVVLIGLNWGNEGNRQALMDGYGWEAANVEAVLNRYLTDAHWDFITGMWSLIGSYRDDAFALQKRMTGTAPKAVEGITFTLASGRKIQGAYFPLKYDGDQESALSVKQQKLDEKQMMAEMGFSFTKPMTRTGHMIERVGSGGKPVKMSIDVLYEHVENVIHDIAFRPAVIDAFKIIRDPAFTAAYIAAAGKAQYDRLMPWLHSIATNNRTRFSTTFSKMMTSMRGRWSVTMMGFSIRTATQQLTGYMEAATEIGPRWVMQGALKTLGAGPSSFWREWAFIRERSEYLANRVAIGKERDIRSVMSSVKPGGALAPVRENAFIFLSMMDAIIGTGVWRGAYDKALAGKVPGIDPADEEAAIAYADRSVQRSLSSGETYQLPEIMREGEISALMTMVYSYGSKTYNRQRLRNLRLRYGQMDLATYTASTFIAFMAVPIIAALLAGRLWPDDDEDEWEDRSDDVGMEVLMNAAGTAPFVRDMVSFLSRPEYGFQLSPVQSTFEQIGGAARDAAEGKTLDSQYRTKQAVFAVATVFGLPGNQLWTTGDYVYDVIMGNEDPTEEPVDAAREALVRDTR